MKKIIISITIVVIVLITILLVFGNEIKSTYYLYTYFDKYDRQQFNDVEGEGIYFNINKKEEAAPTDIGLSYWTTGDNVTLLLLIQSLYKKNTSFQILALLDYRIIDFNLAGRKNNKNDIILNRGHKKIYEIEIDEIPDGAHDLIIMIIPDTPSGNNSEIIFSAHRTIFKNTHTYPQLPASVDARESSAEGCFLYKKDRNLIFNFQKSSFENPESVLLMLFDKRNLNIEMVYCNMANKPDNIEILANFNYSKLINENVQFILFTNPFIPSEFPPGNFTNHMHMSRQYQLIK